MTVQDNTPSVTHVGTGAQLSFPFTFRADDIGWLTLDFLTNFDQFVLNADQDANPGGSADYLVAPPLLQELTITRDTFNTQELDYTRYDPFDSESHEGALDKLTMQIQDLEFFINSVLTQDFDLLGNVDFATKVDGSMVYWDAGTMLWQDTAANVRFVGGQFQVDVASLFIGNVSFEANASSISGNFHRFLNAANTQWADISTIGSVLTIGTPNLSSVAFNGFSGRITQDAETLAYVSELPVLISDHTLLTNIGVNTHVQIDTHIADGTIHFSQASIDHTAIANIGINSHGVIDSHIADASIHFTQAGIDHTVIANIGLNSHASIDAAITVLGSHIANTSIHFADAPADGNSYARNNNGWLQVFSGVTSHLALTDIGVNTHATIDTHIAFAQIHFADAPADFTTYARNNNLWVPVDAPITDHNFLTNNGGVGSHATIDAHMANLTIHWADAPSDGTPYQRQDLGWVAGGAGGGGFTGFGIWRYRTATAATPTAGRMQFDNLTIDSATEMYVNEVNDGGTDVSGFLALLVAGDLVYVQIQDDSTQFIIVEIGTPVLNADVWTFPIVQVEGQGSAPSNNTQVAIVASAGAGGGVSDHLLLTNIGVNTHAQVDTHLANGAIHFTEASINHANILNIGANTHAQIDTHIGDASIHFTVASIDHGLIAGLGDDDHTQYLLLAGRAGGQTAIGGTLAGEQLVLQGSSNADRGRNVLRGGANIEWDWTSDADITGLRFANVVPASGNLISSNIFIQNTIGVNNAVFIMSALDDNSTLTWSVAPGFAVTTLFFARQIYRSSTGGVAPAQAFTLASQCQYWLTGAGSVTTPNYRAVSFAPIIRVDNAGDQMHLTNTVGLHVGPLFNTRNATAVADFGTIRGVYMFNAATILFGQSLGSEIATNWIGVDVEALTGLTVSGIRAAVRSNIPAGANNYLFQNNGGAQSDFGAGDAHWDDNAMATFGNTTVAPDADIHFDGTNLVLDPQTSAITSAKVHIPNGGLIVEADGFPVSDFIRRAPTGNLVLSAWRLTGQSSINMTDGFGTALFWTIEDDAAVKNNIAYVSAERAGADNSGMYILNVYTAGVASQIYTAQADGFAHVATNLGFYGTAPVTQPAAPVTLGDVITALQTLGLTA